MSYIFKINTIFPNLTKSEKKVAVFILKNADKIPGMTLSQISTLCEVGDATVMRFLNKCEYENLISLRFAIVRSMEEKNTFNVSSSDLLNDLKNNISFQLDKTYEIVNKEHLKTVARLIDNSSNIYFFGIGHSGLVAEIGCYRLLRAGKSAKVCSDIHYQAIQASLCNCKDLIIAVSLSGTSPELLNAIQIAKQKGSIIVSIIGNLKSDLTEQSDYTFFATSERLFTRFDGSGLDSLVTQLYILEAIITEYSYFDIQKTRDVGEEITQSFSRQRKNYLQIRKY